MDKDENEQTIITFDATDISWGNTPLAIMLSGTVYFDLNTGRILKYEEEVSPEQAQMN
jgi:hypothetical protein